jgi:hypothetical protein
MRKIPWEGDAALSDEDIRFIVQAGVPGWIERATVHQASFGVDMPDLSGGEDLATKYADDPTARRGEPVQSPGAPQLIDPTNPDAEEMPPAEDVEGDDYDEWNKADLEKEVTGRNQMPNTTEVTVVGTGKDGAVLKVDLVKGLRLWDEENPDALNG